MEIANIRMDDFTQLDIINRQASLSSSFNHSQGDGDGDYYQQPPTASHFSRKSRSLGLLPGLQEALQSLQDGNVRHSLQKNEGVISRPVMRNILPALT